MDFLSQLSALISSQGSALIAGVIAAFTPCILALIPLFLYRFGIWGEPGKHDWKRVVREIGLLLIGYFVSFALSGVVFQQLTNSNFVNATRLTLGLLLLLIGVFQLFGYISVQFINKFSNPLAIGLALPFVISFSPCVLPYFSTLIAGSLSANSVINFTLFGVGILLPAILIALLGKFALGTLRRSQPILHKIEKFSGLLIIFSGFYLATQLVQVTRLDIAIAATALLAVFTWQAYRQWRQRASHTVRNLRNIIISVLLWLAVLIYLLAIAPSTDAGLVGESFVLACSGGHTTCEICTTVALMLALVAVVMAYTVLTATRAGRKFRLTFVPES
ncbi:hypothetical protein KC640_00405 [Candidatus Dojkabacteria bacterium]|uniref:Cytochrome C biogenesis protein transmembrane domain-containing protein n=1 Tax=Candidatus Dojkabacteria bacterium TaxID=2099670 RepID=A0A955I5C6_9BACT|nr:hypothetical protein [Candidatus Dojkabacteria bacterium]